MIGLIIAFLLLASTLAWILIHVKGRYVIKGIIILAVTWYSLALYAAPDNLRGWPTKDELPQGEVLAYRVKEPSPNHDGAIYVWLAPDQERDRTALIVRVLDPDAAFVYFSEDEPRAYRLPYDANKHKKLVQLGRQMEEQQGAWMEFGEDLPDRGQEADEQSQAEMQFRILNPIEILTKEQ